MHSNYSEDIIGNACAKENHVSKMISVSVAAICTVRFSHVIYAYQYCPPETIKINGIELN